MNLREAIALRLAPWLEPDPPPTEFSPEFIDAMRSMQEEWAGRSKTAGRIPFKVRSH